MSPPLSDFESVGAFVVLGFGLLCYFLGYYRGQMILVREAEKWAEQNDTEGS